MKYFSKNYVPLGLKLEDSFKLDHENQPSEY